MCPVEGAYYLQIKASGQTLSVQLIYAHISQQLINVHHNIGQ